MGKAGKGIGWKQGVEQTKGRSEVRQAFSERGGIKSQEQGQRMCSCVDRFVRPVAAMLAHPCRNLVAPRADGGDDSLAARLQGAGGCGIKGIIFGPASAVSFPYTGTLCRPCTACSVCMSGLPGPPVRLSACPPVRLSDVQVFALAVPVAAM